MKDTISIANEEKKEIIGSELEGHVSQRRKKHVV